MMEEDDVKLNAINAGPATTDCMADQYKYDTIRCRDPKEVRWGALGADYVCESTGIFLTKETAQAVFDGGAKKVVSSAPAKDDSIIVMGVNPYEYDSSENFVSCASCTTNGLGRLWFCGHNHHSNV
jgi:glyceraldehyde 3-phosphate dehydrogenase